MPRENEQSFLDEVLKGDQSAISFIQILARISQIYDDLIDDVSAVSADDIHILIWDSLITLQENEFYSAFKKELYPLLRPIIADWVASNALSKDDHEMMISFVIRDNFCMLVMQCAYIIGGREWMMDNAPEIRRHTHEERFSKYLNSENRG